MQHQKDNQVDKIIKQTLTAVKRSNAGSYKMAINKKNIKNNFDAEKEFGFEELEDRLEMAQVAAGDVARCGGTVGRERVV